MPDVRQIASEVRRCCKSGRCGIDDDSAEVLRLHRQIRAQNRFAILNLAGWLVVLGLSIWRIAR